MFQESLASQPHMLLTLTQLSKVCLTNSKRAKQARLRRVALLDTTGEPSRRSVHGTRRPAGFCQLRLAPMGFYGILFIFVLRAVVRWSAVGRSVDLFRSDRQNVTNGARSENDNKT